MFTATGSGPTFCYFTLLDHSVSIREETVMLEVFLVTVTLSSVIIRSKSQLTNVYISDSHQRSGDAKLNCDIPKHRTKRKRW